MSEVVVWSNVPVHPPHECRGGAHVYSAWQGDAYEGTICECGKTRWVYTECPTCKRLSGVSKPIEEPRQ